MHHSKGHNNLMGILDIHAIISGLIPGLLIIILETKKTKISTKIKHLLNDNKTMLPILLPNKTKRVVRNKTTSL